MRDVSKSFMEPVVGKKAACTTVEPEIFFPNYSEGGEFAEALAKRVCRSCPIISECLEFAFHTGDKWAIMGGMTPSERESIRRNQTWREAA